MSTVSGIFEFLKLHGRVTVPEFGVFSTGNSRAVLNSESKTILPPGKQIVFEADYSAKDTGLIGFLADKQKISQETAAAELKTQTEYWKATLRNGSSFSVEGLGEFFVSDNQLVFKGDRIVSSSPDFYGLEEIDLKNIRSGNEIQELQRDNLSESEYKFSKPVLWLFLLVLPVLGLAYFGFTQKERLFGKKSFDDLTVKNSTHRIEKKEPVKVDSVKLKAVADSLTKDSLAKVAAVPVKTTKKWTPKKKWSSKKYTKKKWRPKKRQTR